MKIEKLLSVIEQLKEQKEWSSEDARSGLREFYALLKDHREMDFEEFCSKSRKALVSKKKAKARPKQQLNEAAVARYFSELQQTKTRNADFEAVVNRMRKDRAIRVAEAREVAKMFVGGTGKYKTKTEIFRAILERQLEDKRASAKVERIGDIF